MKIEPGYVLGAMAIGIGATFLMDAWNMLLKRAFRIPSLNYCMLGRWIRHMPSGKFRHANITTATPKPFECPIGWVAHYSIGMTLALAFVVLTSGAALVRPTLGRAMLYGICTVAFPFFIMQPSLGFGMAGSKTPSPMRARIKSLGTHAVFGLGLYLCALVGGYVVGAGR